MLPEGCTTTVVGVPHSKNLNLYVPRPACPLVWGGFLLEKRGVVGRGRNKMTEHYSGSSGKSHDQLSEAGMLTMFSLDLGGSLNNCGLQERTKGFRGWWNCGGLSGK